eukprot:gene2688-3107_t
MLKPTLIVSLLLSSFNLFAKPGLPNDSTLLDSLVKKKVFLLTNGNFNGPGWDMLRDEIKKVQFVMIGEQHGMAEIPYFTGKIADDFKPKALVIEIDPYSAEALKKLALKPATWPAYFKERPYDMAFYSWQTEMELARKMQLQNIDIWGLNEINFLGMERFFTDLAALTKSADNKKWALSMAKTYKEHDKPIFADEKRFGEFGAYTLKAATIDSMVTRFHNESPASKRMLNNLKLSIPAFANNYPMRVNLMKRNLLNYLSPIQTKDSISLPKLLFKFGANHLSRSKDMLRVYEMGNLADNLADAANKKTLHILIAGKQGTSNFMAPVNNSEAIKPYIWAKDDDLSSLHYFYNQVKENQWVIFDLRPLRSALERNKIQIKDPDLKKFITGFDVIVFFDKVSGNKFIE